MEFHKSRDLKKLSGAVALSLMMGGVAMPQAEAAPDAADVARSVSEVVSMPTAGSLSEERQTKREEEGVKLPGGKAEVDTPQERPQLDLPDELKVEVKGFKVTGQDVFPEEDLQAILEKRKGSLMSFKDLEAGADDLAAYFREHGYIAVRVYLPVQKITNGIVEYAVVVGRFDQLTVRNHTDIRERAVNREIRCLKKGEYLTKDKLQRAIWLLSDLAGADAKATLSQGSEPGTVHVEIDLNKHNGKQGLVTVDNYGNRYTGYGEVSVDYDFLNPAKEGDHFAVGGVLTGRNLYNYGFNYTTPLITDGLKLTAGYNVLHYHRGNVTIYEQLEAYGMARIASLGLDYAIRRSQKYNLYTGLRYEYASLEDEYRLFSEKYVKHGNAGVWSIYGDETDHYGTTWWRIENKIGDVSYDSDDLEWFKSAGTDGHFYKLKGNILRREDLSPRSYLLLSARGQVSDHNLDSSEHMSLGGFNGVRAYPQSEASGDCGYLTRAELRWLLPLKKKDQQLQLATYFDHGRIRINKDSRSTVGRNIRHLEGVGIGLIWSRWEDWFLRVDYAWRVGPERALSDTHHSADGHFWIRGGVYF